MNPGRTAWSYEQPSILMAQGHTSTMARSDAEVLRTGYDAFAVGDVPALLAVFAEDITFHIPGDHPLAGEFTGQQEVVACIEKLVELSDGTFSATPRDILDNGSGTVVALCTLDAERNGQRGTFDIVQVWSFQGGRPRGCASSTTSRWHSTRSGRERACHGDTCIGGQRNEVHVRSQRPAHRRGRGDAGGAGAACAGAGAGGDGTSAPCTVNLPDVQLTLPIAPFVRTRPRAR